MTTDQYVPYALGYTRTTMDRTMGREAVKRSQSHQNCPQFGLKAATRLHEAGIASKGKSACSLEYVPGSCTHRLSNHESWEHLKYLWS